MSSASEPTVPSQTVHPITRVSATCSRCGLPTLTCLCEQLQPISTRSRFILLTRPKERARASNTGRLLKLLTPDSTDIIVWERNQPDPELLKQLQAHPSAYLVFPPEPDTPPESLVSELSLASSANPPLSPLFILIDGTWQEARKISRKSAYLQALPRLSLPGELHSDYTLRERQPAGSLCTIEAAIECLKLAAEPAAAEHLQAHFRLFLKHYQAGLCGHAVKAETSTETPA